MVGFFDVPLLVIMQTCELTLALKKSESTGPMVRSHTLVDDDHDSRVQVTSN